MQKPKTESYFDSVLEMYCITKTKSKIYDYNVQNFFCESEVVKLQDC